jgi:HAD superfamily hydrolase (TIGR01549 family)
VSNLERIIQLSSISLDFCIDELSKEFAISKEALDEQFVISYDTVRLEEQRPFPHVVEVLKKVKELNGQNFIVTHRRRESLSELLSLYQIMAYFTDIVAGDDGFPRKPDSSAMRYSLEKYSLTASNVLVVGDRDIDIRAGQHIGTKTCLFRGSFAVSPDLKINNFDELLVSLQKPVSF